MKPSTDHTLRAAYRFATACIALCLAAASPCAVAAPPAKSKVVQALIGAAQKEFDAGNFERAGELFLEIYRQDPETRAALYNAARAYQLGGKVDRADELFRELLAAPDMDAALKVKAQAQLEILQVKRGERKADEADRAEKAGNYAAAAGLWGEAIRIQASRAPWLLRHARALHLAGQHAPALAAYDRYLAAVPASDPERAHVDAWRHELMAKLALQPEKPVPPPEKPVVPVAPAGAPTPTVPPVAPTVVPAVAPVAPVVPPAPPSVVSPPAVKPTPVLPLVLLGTGGALLVSGLAVVSIASSDEKALLTKFDTKKKISLITHAAATAEANRISGNYALGWGLTGLGVIGAGIGAWLWLGDSPAQVTIVPAWDGLMVVGRF